MISRVPHSILMGERRQWIGLTILAVFSLLAALVNTGCVRTFRGKVVQPNPLLFPNETLRESEKVTIVTGDMELNLPHAVPTSDGGVEVSRRYPLKNAASFTVVSRDRLRFHVQIEHKWQEWADLHTWDVYLVDDQGRRYEPEAVERAAAKHLATMWDYEQRSVVRNRLGDVVGVNRDGHLRRVPLGSLSVFRGNGDFVFYSRDIFTPDIKGLTLVLARTTTAFAFTWRFAEEQGAPGLRAGTGLERSGAGRISATSCSSQVAPCR